MTVMAASLESLTHLSHGGVSATGSPQETLPINGQPVSTINSAGKDGVTF